VSQWDDKSGNGRNVTQGTGASQPTTGTRTINGLNVLDFDGNDLLGRTTATQLVSTVDGTFTAFTVVLTDTVAAGVSAGIMTQDSGSGTRMPQMLRRLGDLRGTVRVAGGVFSDYSGTVVTTTVPVTLATAHQTNNIEAWVGGLSDGPTATTGSNGTIASVVRVGVASGTVQNFDGTIAEIIVYPYLLANDDFNLVGSYLSTKWGVSWSPI
jgi:hypothetical protein